MDEQDQIYKSHELFDLSTLIAALLLYKWQHECVIDPTYTIIHTGEQKCVVYWDHEDGGRQYLRIGRLETFWDVYGDDFGTAESALVALSKSVPPTRGVGPVIPTHGERYVAWGRIESDCIPVEMK